MNHQQAVDIIRKLFYMDAGAQYVKPRYDKFDTYSFPYWVAGAFNIDINEARQIAAEALHEEPIYMGSPAQHDYLVAEENKYLTKAMLDEIKKSLLANNWKPFKDIGIGFCGTSPLTPEPAKEEPDFLKPGPENKPTYHRRARLQDE